MFSRTEPQPGLGLAIKEIREQSCITREELASKSGLAVQWIKKVETGHSDPVWGDIRKLAFAPRVELFELAQLAEELDDRTMPPATGSQPGEALQGRDSQNE